MAMVIIAAGHRNRGRASHLSCRGGGPRCRGGGGAGRGGRRRCSHSRGRRGCHCRGRCCGRRCSGCGSGGGGRCSRRRGCRRRGRSGGGRARGGPTGAQAARAIANNINRAKIFTGRLDIFSSIYPVYLPIDPPIRQSGENIWEC